LLNVIDHGRVRELRLARPPVNALDRALMNALAEAIRAAPEDGCGALVVSGSPGRFSGGLDLPELLGLPAPELRATWVSFFGLMRAIATSALPVAAALTGHSPAGGTVLAVFADHRVMAAGAYKVGLNEVQVGLPVPPLLLRGLSYLVGERQAERLAVGGLLLSPDEAQRVGLVDEVAPLEEVVPRAVAWAADLLTRPPHAMSATRRTARRPLVEAFDALDDAAMDAVMAAWNEPEAQATLRALAARLGKKRGV
jgi:enoyl-CoA hydratase/carnithine racemase